MSKNLCRLCPINTISILGNKFFDEKKIEFVEGWNGENIGARK